MVSIKSILLAGACAITAVANPVLRATTLTASMLIAIDKNTQSCPASLNECTAAAAAAPALNNAFAKYGITTPGEQAALIAYMLFESSSFRYNHNISPGRPGQGTRMMAMPTFVAKYAAVAAAPSDLSAAMQKTGNDQLTAILATVTKTDDLSFGAAPWFLNTTCTPVVRTGLASGSLDGWHTFISSCVGTTPTSDRDAPWLAAKSAFGLA